MNFSITTFFLFVTVAASASVLETARRLDETDENEYAFLGNYQMKMISCYDTSFSQTGFEMEQTGYVIFRLCPSNSDCSDVAGKSCDAGYGEYILGLNQFVNEYSVQISEEMQVDDDFDIDQLAYCRQFADSVYYAGPTCTADGTNIRMALFTDDDCFHLAENVIFDDISAGNTLPYYEGRLVSDSCQSCSIVNGNDEAGINEMCLGLHKVTILKCESEMEFRQYNPDDDFAFCDSIAGWYPKTEQSGGGMVIFMIIVPLLIVIGLVGLAFLSWRRRRRRRAQQNASKPMG